MRSITLILSYYDNPQMLLRQYGSIGCMPDRVRRHIRMIVVDDGSPNAPAEGGLWGVPLEVYRITVDVRWNQDAARNLGVDHARDGWVLLTDIDHLVPQATFEALVAADLDESKVYRFSRVSEPDFEPYKPHPNSWLMTKAMFDRIGGYDERFAGLYGTDAEFRDRVVATADVVMLPEVLVRVPREVTPDASTTTYLRKQPEDREGIPRIKAERARDPNWRPQRLSFPWMRVF